MQLTSFPSKTAVVKEGQSFASRPKRWRSA